MEAHDWLTVIRQEYLDDFVRQGGAAVKCVVPTDGAGRTGVREGLRASAAEGGYQFCAVDAAEVKIHLVDQLFHAIALEREIARRGPDHVGQSGTVRLLELYELLTLLPGQAREYSRQEFARDVYLLEQSGTTTTRKGHRVRFPASTGTRRSGDTLRIIAEHGQE